MFTHIVLLASKQVPPATIKDLVAETRRTYAGRWRSEKTWMRIEIGETITVQKLEG